MHYTITRLKKLLKENTEELDLFDDPSTSFQNMLQHIAAKQKAIENIKATRKIIRFNKKDYTDADPIQPHESEDFSSFWKRSSDLQNEMEKDLKQKQLKMMSNPNTHPDYLGAHLADSDEHTERFINNPASILMQLENPHLFSQHVGAKIDKITNPALRPHVYNYLETEFSKLKDIDTNLDDHLETAGFLNARAFYDDFLVKRDNLMRNLGTVMNNIPKTPEERQEFYDRFKHMPHSFTRGVNNMGWKSALEDAYLSGDIPKEHLPKVFDKFYQTHNKKNIKNIPTRMRADQRTKDDLETILTQPHAADNTIDLLDKINDFRNPADLINIIHGSNHATGNPTFFNKFITHPNVILHSPEMAASSKLTPELQQLFTKPGLTSNHYLNLLNNPNVEDHHKEAAKNQIQTKLKPHEVLEFDPDTKEHSIGIDRSYFDD